MVVDVLVNIAARNETENLTKQMCDLIIHSSGDDDSSVRVRLVSKIPVIAETVPSLCTSLTPTIKEMFKDQFWRIRATLATTMPAVLKYMGVEVFVSNYLDEYLKLLKDSVGDVRVATANSLLPLILASGVEFILVSVCVCVCVCVCGDDYINTHSYYDYYYYHHYYHYYYHYYRRRYILH